MTNRWSALAIVAIMLTGCMACSSQQSGNSASSGTQVVSASSGHSCRPDVKRVCEDMRNKPVVDSNTGLTYDATELEQNSTRTAQEFTTFQIPNGSLIQVECEINTLHHSVVYAHMMPGPPLTATDIAYIRQAGYCAQ